MRDYRDSKNMAQTLRKELAQKHCKISVGESLELVARLFGVSDWNTLSALIKGSDPATDSSHGSKQSRSTHFATTLEETLRRALRIGANAGQSEVTVEHLLLSLTEDKDASTLMRACGVKPSAIRDSITRSIDFPSVSYDMRGNPDPSQEFERVLQGAIIDVTASGAGAVTGAHVLLAILSEQDSAAAQMLREHGINRARAAKFSPGEGAA